MRTIRSKLLAPFIFGALMLSLVLPLYAFNAVWQSIEGTVLLIAEAKTDQVSNTIRMLFKSMSTTMLNMVVEPHVLKLFPGSDEHTRGETAKWLEALIQSNESYRDILIVDARGMCIASSNPRQIGRSYADRPYVQQALQGLFSYGEISVGRVTKKFSVIAAGPIDTVNGVAGALVMFVDLPNIVDYDTKHRYDSHEVFTALMEPQGMFLAHNNLKYMGNTELRFPELYKTLARVGEQGGVVQYALDGHMYFGFARLEKTSGTLVVASGIKRDVFASAYDVGTSLFAISLLFLFIIASAVYHFASDILHVLLVLVQYAKRVSEGALELQLDTTTRKDELGVLHNALHNLASVLQDALHESKEASKTKSQFLANMSHEIRTPLNAIIGMTHLSLRDGDLSAKQLTYLQKIQLSANSLLGLINDILDLSKVEAGMLAIEHIPFNMRETAENILAVHHDIARDKGLALSLEYSDDAPVFMIGDPLRIGQVLNNLVSNALKFTKQGGVSVRCWGETDEESRTATMRVSVTDTGIGMSQTALSILFQPFTQADASITRKFGGTGLGLVISKRIIELMEGDISVESTEGCGSTFSFFMKLPLAEESRREKEDFSLAAAFETLDIRDKRILVAEDNAINQFVLQELLEPSGAQIVMTNNGQEALDAVKAQPFDLVLMDMQMPVMDGLEATVKIREFLSAASLPIIAVTANAMTEDKDKGFMCGMNDYLTKPINPEELMRTLRAWLVDKNRPPQQ